MKTINHKPLSVSVSLSLFLANTYCFEKKAHTSGLLSEMGFFSKLSALSLFSRFYGKVILKKNIKKNYVNFIAHLEDISFAHSRLKGYNLRLRRKNEKNRQHLLLEISEKLVCHNYVHFQ